MANTSFAYVRTYEQPDPILPNVYILIRIDGKGFHRFSSSHSFTRPNDAPALELMNAAARHVMDEFRPDVVLAFGESDEYSFLLRRRCALYGRRASKLLTQIVSLFTSAYLFHWSECMSSTSSLPSSSSNPSASPSRQGLGAMPSYPPIFDGRVVLYPTEREVRDYFAWRQADTHINNLYNTTFWALVQQGGQTEAEAHETLKGTVSSQKHEILHSRFGINYDSLPAMFRKGTTLAWDVEGPSTPPSVPSSGTTRQTEGEIGGAGGRKGGGKKPRNVIRTLHVDIIGKTFWDEALDAVKEGKKAKAKAKQRAKGKAIEEREGQVGNAEVPGEEGKGQDEVTQGEVREKESAGTAVEGIESNVAAMSVQESHDERHASTASRTAPSTQPPWLSATRLDKYAGLGWNALQA